MRAAAEKEPATEPAPFPWEEVLHVGLHLLRLEPNAFWAMTPREFFIMAGGLRPGRSAPGRDELTRLMGAFPDVLG